MEIPNTLSRLFFILSVLESTVVVDLFLLPISTVLTKYYKLRYKKHSATAWVPILNIYTLGTLAVNKVVGLLLAFLNIVSVYFSYTEYGAEYTSLNLLRSIILSLHAFLLISFLVIVLVKYNKLKAEYDII